MARMILLVEDDADAREIYAAALIQAGFSVITATHGAEGVHLARKARPQLILMDLRMPLMDGRSSLQYLRSDPETRSIPVWALSAFLDDEEDRGTRFPQFDRLISKPIAPENLVTVVSAFLGAPGAAGSPLASDPTPEPGSS